MIIQVINLTSKWGAYRQSQKPIAIDNCRKRANFNVECSTLKIAANGSSSCEDFWLCPTNLCPIYTLLKISSSKMLPSVWGHFWLYLLYNFVIKIRIRSILDFFCQNIEGLIFKKVDLFAHSNHYCCESPGAATKMVRPSPTEMVLAV